MGMLVGGCHKRASFWEGVLGKIRSKLGSWKGKFVSMAGRIFLIKLVLTSLTFFYLSFYRVPTTVAKE